MIQLKVYDSPAKKHQYWIDLYETEPIKLTLSIEDIQTADATSVYSKAFKVPGTRKNAEFFKNSFDVDDTLFDVTIKKPAEILVDGAEFKVGHVRLQKIFLNQELDRYDYELLFLGETRDFSSRIGDKGLCELNMPELIGGPTGGTLTAADIIQSWQAYPQNPSLTAGLHNGDIIYPLIDHGNTYDSSGIAEQSRISVIDSNRFTQNSHPLTLDRLKPMIRAKRIWDKIFEDAGYTYTSSFIDSDLFHQIYVSAFGNKATVGWDIEPSSTSSVNVAHAQEANSDLNYQLLTQAINDPGNNLSVITHLGQQTTVYTVPVIGEYQIAGQCYYYGQYEDSDYTPHPTPAQLILYNITQGVALTASTVSLGTLQFNVTLNTSTTPNFAVGDQLCLLISIPGVYPDYYYVNNVALDIIKAPGEFNPVSGLECTYKQIDFVKDILTAFRLVFSPDPNNPNNFIIEPWQEYINSGNLHDWSKKLVENKDVQIEPVFFTQANQIDFQLQKDGDYINIYHEQATKFPYGRLLFNANNDLLNGKRDVKLIGIAATEVANIEGSTPADHFIIPQLHTHSAEDTGIQHLPIKPKTRLLFYNGLKSAGVNPWYLQGAGVNPQTVYPMVSPYEVFPIQPQTLNLNWANDIQYWGTTAGYNENGATLYDNYWSRYINSLYGKYSRRVTAYFVLNNIDLNQFSFDDTVFVNGTYYIPEKIIDVEIGDYTEVKVQLLTANDFRPAVIPAQDLFVNSITGVAADCLYGLGQIDINTNGTPGFTWTLSNGMSGTALSGAAPGQSSYDFSILNVPDGTYTITIVDSLGRSDSQTVIVPASSATAVTATAIITHESQCGSCDGSISVTPSGGAGAPYTIEWGHDPLITSFTLSDLCAGTYSYTVFDSLGCAQQSYIAEITCEAAPGNVWEFYRSSSDCTQIQFFTRRVFYPTGTAPQIGRFYTLTELGGRKIKGCWTPVEIVTTPANALIQTEYQTCQECNGLIFNNFIAQECITGEKTVVENTFGIEIGQVYRVAGTDACWTIVDTINAPSTNLVDSLPYNSCNECQGGGAFGMLSNKPPLTPSEQPVCAIVHPYDIYNNQTFDAYHILEGSYMYEDAALTIPWDGDNGWYSIANQNNPNLAAVSILVKPDGYVSAVEFCS